MIFSSVETRAIAAVVGIGLAAAASADRGRNFRSLADDWPQCGADDCRAECANRCQYNPKFNPACCDICPNVAGFVPSPQDCTVDLGSGRCDNVDRSCTVDSDCNVRTCAGGPNAGQFCGDNTHCISLSRDAGPTGWFDWNSGVCTTIETGECVETAAPSSMPSLAPSVSAAPSSIPSASPSSKPSQGPSGSPSSVPSLEPSGSPSESPSFAPSSVPSASPIGLDFYEYRDTGPDDRIELWAVQTDGSDMKVDVPRESDVHFKFFAMADLPYDPDANTCLDGNGQKLDPCPFYDGACSARCENDNDIYQIESDCNGDPGFDDIPIDNNCTYEGDGFKCLRDSIIPFIKGKRDDALFVAHVGDLWKGNNRGRHRRCTQASFDSRSTLFAELEDDAGNDSIDFFIVTGDNDWRECVQRPINRERWRNAFTTGSIFDQFNRAQLPTIGEVTAFPSVNRASGNGASGGSETFFFVAGDSAVIGINHPAGQSGYQVNNAAWFRDNIGDNCAFKSIIIFGHDDDFDDEEDLLDLTDELEVYYNTCGPTPTIYFCGDDHPPAYELSFSELFPDNVLILLWEGEVPSTPPALISIVVDPSSGDHFFHVERDETAVNNPSCPSP